MPYRKLIIDGNAVYEIDEECMEQQRRKREEWERRHRIGKSGEEKEGTQ